MTERIFNVGDELRIREWDDMKSEFGIDTSNKDCIFIPCKLHFTESMKHLCGRNFTVKEVLGIRYKSTEGIEDINGGWSISADMLEPRIKKDLEVATEDEIQMLFS